MGLHPLGARWIQEHYLVHGEQETTSYYGILNVPALNVGYHNEHHDFPSVPWNRLPLCGCRRRCMKMLLVLLVASFFRVLIFILLWLVC